jgi:GNAT superfamily N-acetyltransferase
MPDEKLSVICRPGRESDTADVLELTRTIWDGEDYVPAVWSSWLADPAGYLAVAELDGRVVGLGHINRQGPTDWWLQGLRTRPDLQGQGIASQLHDHLVDWWLGHGAGMLRLATLNKRLAVHRLCERTGFVRVLEYSEFNAPAVSEPVTTFRPISSEEVPAAAALARQSETVALNGGMLDLAWEWMAVGEQPLGWLAEKGQAWWWEPAGAGEPRGVLAVWMDDEADPPQPWLSLAACPLAGLPALLIDYLRLAAGRGFTQAGWNTPLLPETLAAALAAGFWRGWEDSVYLFVKEHPTRPFMG